MRPATQLYDLQLLDWEIQKREEALADIRARLADDSRRAATRRQRDAIAGRIESLAAPRRQAERDIQDIERRIAEIDARLYDGSVTNPRELEAYQEERATLSGNQSEREDALLELMVEAEDAEETLEQASGLFDRVNAEREAEIADLQSGGKALSDQLPELHDRRATLSAEYPPIALSVYESVRQLRGGQGAALVDRRGLCQGCRLVIPTNELQRVRAGQELVQCGSCSRILIAE